MVSMPCAMASLVDSMRTFSPLMKISPLVSGTTPDRTLMRVDLPAPLSPSKPTISFLLMVTVTSSSAWTRP